jgi:hypothetical protein
MAQAFPEQAGRRAIRLQQSDQEKGDGNEAEGYAATGAPFPLPFWASK